LFVETRKAGRVYALVDRDGDFKADQTIVLEIHEHGSWNRSEPIGYRITRVRLTNGRPASYEVFASGWLRDDGVIGRPVDLAFLEDGSMLVSDDDAGRIYRITFQP